MAELDEILKRKCRGYGSLDRLRDYVEADEILTKEQLGDMLI